MVLHISANGIDAIVGVLSFPKKNPVQDSHEQKDTELLADQNPRRTITKYNGKISSSLS